MFGSGEPLHRPTSVTAANWQEANHNRWAFWHLRELLPSQCVPRVEGAARPFPRRTGEELLDIEVTRHDSQRATVAEVLRDTHTDAFAVAHNGAMVAEEYAPTGGPMQPHALMSVTKCVVGCVAGILTEQGMLAPEREVTTYVPELAASGFAGATVQHLLDMRSGVRFREDYANPRAEVRRLDKWIIQVPTRPSDQPRGLYRFLTTLRQEAPHGSRFLYRSAETDALGWVCERAGGTRMADLIASLLWRPMGAEQDADLLCDGFGTAVHDGGLATTARDLLRFGQMLLDGGAVPDGADGWRQVVPAGWLRAARAVDVDGRRTFRESLAEPSFPGGWYRNQFWFRPGAHGDVLLGLGIHGQMLHVSPRTRTVCVKFSSWPDAQSAAYLDDTLRALDAVGGALAGQARPEPGRHAPGVVSGMHGAAATTRRTQGTGAAGHQEGDTKMPPS